MITATDLDRVDAARWQPPSESRSIYEFAETVRFFDGPLAGQKLKPSAERAIDLWLQTLASRRYKWHVLVGPTQRAKTTTGIIIPWLHGLIEDRVNVGYIMPSLEKLGQKWEGSLKPMIDGGGYGAYLPEKGPGSHGGRPGAMAIRDPDTRLRLAMAYFMALGKGGTETQTSSNPCAKLLLDEGDDAKDVGQLQLAQKRTNSYGAAGGGVITSTVNHVRGRDGHPILEMYETGTKTRMAHHCPHCLAHVIPDFESFDFERSAIVCPGCGVLWSEQDRHVARNAAIYKHEVPDALVFSVLYTQLDYFWEYPDPRTGKVELVFPTISADYKAAKASEMRDSSAMRLHMHKVWCRKYVEPVPEGEINNDTLSKLSAQSTVDKRSVPPWVLFLVLTQDVQGDRHYWEAVGFGAEDRWCIIDWGYETLVPFEGGKPVRQPTPADRRFVLNKIRDLADHGWQIAGTDRRMRPVQRGVDVGFETKEVVAWLQGEPEWKALRGVGRDENIKSRLSMDGEELELPPEIARTKSIIAKRPDGWRSYWYRIDGHQFRRQAHAALLRSPEQPASGQVPRGLKSNDALLLHLSAEVWEPPKASKAGYWREVRSRNDWLDCLVYALALALLHRHRPEMHDDGSELPMIPDDRPSDDRWDSNLDPL